MQIVAIKTSDTRQSAIKLDANDPPKQLIETSILTHTLSSIRYLRRLSAPQFLAKSLCQLSGRLSNNRDVVAYSRRSFLRRS